MPPPTKFDPWLANRRFGIIIDAGSSGSRVQLYSWTDARVMREELTASELEALPIVEKGTMDPENSILKIEPGTLYRPLVTASTDISLPRALYIWDRPRRNLRLSQTAYKTCRRRNTASSA